MNKFFSALILLGIALSTQKNYWSLGVSIKDVSAKKIIQKEVDLNKLILDSPTNTLKEEPLRKIYTLKTNYFVAPKSIESSASHDYQKSFKDNLKKISKWINSKIADWKLNQSDNYINE